MMGYIFAACGVAIIILSGTIYFLKLDNDTLHENNGKLEVLFQTQKAATDALKKNIDRFANALTDQAKLTNDLAKFQTEAGRTLQRMNDVFAKHDFQKLLDKKPGLIIRRVNNAIADINRMFECETDSSRCSGDRTGKP